MLPTDKINAADFRIKRVTDETTVLAARIEELGRTIDDLRRQVEAERAARTALQARYEAHVHTLRGQVGQGFLSGRIDGVLRKFLIPAETEAARRSLATTGAPKAD